MPIQWVCKVYIRLFYVPGSFTPTEEVVELSRVVANYGGIYISHIREEAAQLLDSVAETIQIGEQANIPVQVTHHKVIGVENWGSSVESLRMIDEARARGIDVTVDQLYRPETWVTKRSET